MNQRRHVQSADSYPCHVAIQDRPHPERKQWGYPAQYPQIRPFLQNLARPLLQGLTWTNADHSHGPHSRSALH